MKTRILLRHLPPSVNAIWRHGASGKSYRTNEYNTWANGEGWELKEQMKGQHKFTGPVYIVAAMRRPRSNADLDNRIKGIGDLLQQHGAIADDKDVHGWNVYWSQDVPSGYAAEVSIAEADPGNREQECANHDV